MSVVELVTATEQEMSLHIQHAGHSRYVHVSSNWMHEAIERKSLLTIRSDDEAVGFIIESVVLDEAELLQLLIYQNFRNCSFAKFGMNLWHKKLIEKGIAKAYLEVNETNVIALKLYRSLDYQVVGRRKSYYKSPTESDDALLMECLL